LIEGKGLRLEGDRERDKYTICGLEMWYREGDTCGKRGI
jgi:hypothetical protein